MSCRLCCRSVRLRGCDGNDTIIWLLTTILCEIVKRESDLL